MPHVPLEQNAIYRSGKGVGGFEKWEQRFFKVEKEIFILTIGFAKGQLISKCPFAWCLQIEQKTNKIFVRISALASKKRSNKKVV